MNCNLNLAIYVNKISCKFKTFVRLFVNVVIHKYQDFIESDFSYCILLYCMLYMRNKKIMCRQND